ncbi:MAG TPA: SGNH/GDSL hydrolase family protein [Vicinamibacterales bacterium]|nr:SGNH/GDSL hydrolase family protein [Vicinamibacterales bacterium]
MRFTQRLLVLLLVALTAVPAVAQTARGERWVAAWATALVARPAPVAGAPAGRGGGPGGPPPVTISNQTIRQIVRASIGASRVRVVLSNAFGTAPVEIGAAHIGLRAKEAEVVAGTVRRLTFGGRSTGTILPGAVLLSDPVDLDVPPLADVAIDLFVPGELGVGPSPVTTHNGAGQTNYLSEPGNHSGAAAVPIAGRANAWFLLARLEVMAPAGTQAVVAFGDSITDGARATPDMNARWPDQLARRLAARRGGPPVAVLNAGISGNRVLGDGAGVSALARFDRDVLMQTGVTHVIILEGINDIGIARSNPSPSVEDLIAGHRQLIERARARGLRVYGATLTPFEGAAYWTPEGEAKRQALNQWIRTSGAYDAVIDFDRITRDPAAPTKFLPAYDSGDHLHPGDAGYKAMGEAIDLALFGSR